MNKGENFRDHLRLFNELNIHLVLKKYNWSDLFPNIKHDKIKPLKKKTHNWSIKSRYPISCQSP
jgi:hypothetical protein